MTSTTSLTTGSTGGATTGPDEPLGELEGACGELDAAELSSPDSFLFENAIDFGVLGFDYDLLTPGGKEVFDDGNLNQSSLHSEVIAYEVLARCDMAALLKTEGEVVYDDPMGKKTDLLVELDGLKVGVSVTRAYGFPPDDPYTVAQAESLLTDKLSDIPLSTANVAPEDQWVKQILHVIAYAEMHAESIATAYAGLPDNVKGDTIVVVTVTHGDDEFIY